jgi:predicted DNA-binding antitoxin AbrB/MazE fold protein
MLKVKGIYDGKKVKILEKVNIPDGKPQEVIITFLNENVYTEAFDLKEFINDWSSEEIESIEQIYNTRESFFDGREFSL